MRIFIRTAVAVSLFTLSLSAQAPDARPQRPPMTPEQGSSARINPMIALHEKGLPVFGVTHPQIVAGRGPGRPAGADATPAPLPSLTAAAQETVAYRFSDFAYDNYS